MGYGLYTISDIGVTMDYRGQRIPLRLVRSRLADVPTVLLGRKNLSPDGVTLDVQQFQPSKGGEDPDAQNVFGPYYGKPPHPRSEGTSRADGGVNLGFHSPPVVG